MVAMSDAEIVVISRLEIERGPLWIL